MNSNNEKFTAVDYLNDLKSSESKQFRKCSLQRSQVHSTRRLSDTDRKWFWSNSYNPGYLESTSGYHYKKFKGKKQVCTANVEQNDLKTD